MALTMKYRRWTSLVAFVLLVITLAWLSLSPPTNRTPGSGPDESGEVPTAVKARHAPPKPDSAEDAEGSPAGNSNETKAQSSRAKGNANATALVSARFLPAALSGPELGPGLTPLAVMENMRSVFRNFSSRYGGNPVGNNHEITTALTGANPNQVMFINEEDGLRINERGELIDNWGTPFFFHQLSAREMEIRSAGPDRKM
jgi:hypothetical protein